MANFDGITYAKGAAVLRQLAAWVGEDKFRDGLRRYVDMFAFANTDLSDLLTCLEDASGRSLDEWSSEWLRTAGLNALTGTLDIRDGDIAACTVTQDAPQDWPTPRRHRVKVGLYNHHDGQLRLRRQESFEIEGPHTVLHELTGDVAPDLLLLNDDYLAYAKTPLDAHSLQAALCHVGGSSQLRV